MAFHHPSHIDPTLLPSPVLEFAVPPAHMVLPIFQLDDTFRPAPTSIYGVAGDGDLPPMAHLGSAAVMNRTASDSTDDVTTSSGSSGDTTPLSRPVHAKVLRDAAVAGPVTIDMNARPNLNLAPPNWNTRDEEHGGHIHWPWRGSAVDRSYSDSDRIPTGLEELLDALRSEQPAAAEPTSLPPELPDVVTGAEELKALLMAPFVQPAKPLSLLVHRIGESLLIERASRYDVPGSATGPHTTVADNRKKALASKLLYYSILAESERPLPLVPSPPVAPLEGTETALPPTTPPAAAKTSTSSTAEQRDPYFRRALKWKFDDLSILLGSKTPLVRGPNGNDMTLQVHDHNQYVSQVEALEYWLDNVLNSIGHVALCFHVDGVVQGYRVIPTDDLPNLGDVPFSPVAVQGHASHVLRWLRSTCRKEGGSYVLLRAPGTKDLRLYDIEELHRYRDVAILSSLTLPQTQPIPPPPSAPPPSSSSWSSIGESQPPVPTPPKRGTANTNDDARPCSPLDGIDDDDDTNTAGRLKPQHLLAAARRDFASAFDQPIAVMCFRMAQCLPPTDAEATRLHLRALALLPSDDVPTALLRAACHVHASQFAASSGLASCGEESDRLSRHHARGAVQELATVISASAETFFVPVQQDVPPLVTAITLGASLARLMCGAATRQCHERRYHDVVASLAVVQGYLAHFEEVVPAGLLTDRVVPPMTPDVVTPDVVGRNTTGPKGTAKQTKVQRAELRVELLATVASIETVLGDVLRSLLEQIGGDEAKAVLVAHGVASNLRDALNLHKEGIRRLSVTAQHETAEVMTLVHRGRQSHVVRPGSFVAPLTYDEALAAMPEHLAPLRRLIDVGVPSSETLFESACAFYHKALAHIPTLHSTSEGAERSALDIKRKIARAHATLATNLGLRFASCEAYCKEDDPTNSIHRGAGYRDWSTKLLHEAEEAFAHAADAFIAVEDYPQFIKMAHNRAMRRLKIAERISEVKQGQYSHEEQQNLDAAAVSLRDALQLAQNCGANSNDEVYTSAEAALANMLLIACARFSSLLTVPLAKRPIVQPSMQSLKIGEPGVTIDEPISLCDVEKRLVDQYLLPAVKAAKQSQRAPLEVRCLQVLADTRRFFAGIEPLQAFANLVRPLQCMPDVWQCIQSRPSAERVERATMAATSIRTAHSFNCSSGVSFFAFNLIAADAHLFVLKNLSKEALEAKVQAIESAVGVLHDVKAVLQQQVEATAGSGLDATIVRDAHEMGKQLAQRLAEVLLVVLKLQQEQQSATASKSAVQDGGVKALCKQALEAVNAAPTATGEKSAAALCLEVLNNLPTVFRSFTDNRRRTRR